MLSIHSNSRAFDSGLDHSEVRASNRAEGLSGVSGGVKDYHPSPDLLKRFLSGTLPPEERRRVVRHLLRGCPSCRKVTRELWLSGYRLPV